MNSHRLFDLPRRCAASLGRLLLCLVFLAAGCSDSADPALPGEPGTLRLMSYNLRNANSDLLAWHLRKQVVARAIIEQRPDVLGVQEADEPWMQALPLQLPDYAHVGVGRDDGQAAGEFSAIFYRKAKFELVESGTFWLSETPATPSFGWGAHNRRICTWAYLRHRETGRITAHFNTHLDHQSEQARRRGAALILERMAQSPYPAALTGDLNLLEGSPVYRRLLSGGLFDPKFAADDTMDHGTINFFVPDRPDFGLVIDFVLAQSQHFIARRYEVALPYEFEYRAAIVPASDHYPVVVDLALAN